VEIVAVLRRAIRRRLLHGPCAHAVLEDYLDLPLTRHPHAPLAPRMLELRDNFGAYDAAYVALAEGLAAAFLTHDQRLGRSVTDLLDIELV
jgi:predicted nucleic acid-binding protein